MYYNLSKNVLYNKYNIYKKVISGKGILNHLKLNVFLPQNGISDMRKMICHLFLTIAMFLKRDEEKKVLLVKSCFPQCSLSLRLYTHRPLAECLTYKPHKMGNTSEVSKLSSDRISGICVCHVLCYDPQAIPLAQMTFIAIYLLSLSLNYNSYKIML